MDEQKNKSPELNDLIFETMNEVLESRSDIRKWLLTEHTIKDTEARLQQLTTQSGLSGTTKPEKSHLRSMAKPKLCIKNYKSPK